MDVTRTYKHQNYELQCTARPMDGGRFAPSLIVAKQVWPTRPREIAVQRGEHLTADTAIDAAHSQGIAWIHEYG